MSRSIFGWDLPPGCSSRDVENAFGQEYPCEVCGRWADDCVCEECPVCQTFGDPRCYVDHGLKRTPQQIAGAVAMRWDVELQDQYWVQRYEEQQNEGDEL